MRTVGFFLFEKFFLIFLLSAALAVFLFSSCFFFFISLGIYMNIYILFICVPNAEFIAFLA